MLAAVSFADLALVFGYYQLIVQRFVAHNVWIDVSQIPEQLQYDAGVVFFGALEPDGLLDGDTRRRVQNAAELYAHSRIREVIAVGGARRDLSSPGAEAMAAFLRSGGVAPEHVTRDSLSYDSVTNWEQALAIARRRDLDSLLLISAPTHLLRLAHLVVGSGVTVGYYGGRTDGADRPSCPRRWRTAHREALAFVALWVLPRSWYVSILKRVRVSS